MLLRRSQKAPPASRLAETRPELIGNVLASLGDATGTGRWAAAAFGHTEADTVDKVSLRGLQMSAALAARLAITLAQEEELPALHRSPDDVRKALQEAGLSEFLEGHWGLANRVSGSQIRS